MNVAQFTLNSRKELLGDMVIKRGKIFRAGVYADKNFAVDREELKRAVDQFRAVPIDMEHRPSILDNKLGQLFAVELAEDGEDLIGAIAIPSWLDTAMGDEDLTVSTEWDAEKKLITKLALAKVPRVSDAKMVDAYRAFTGDTTPIKKENPAMTKLQEWWNSLTKEQRAETTPEQIAQFSSTADADTTPAPTTTTTTTTPAPPAPSPVADPRIAQLEAQVAQFAANERSSKASTFVAKQVREARLLPAMQDVAAAMLSAAMRDDETSKSKITFSQSDGSTIDVSRQALVEQFISSLPKHSLFSEQRLLDAPEGSILLSASADAQGKSAYDQGLDYGKDWSARNQQVQAK